MPRGFFFMARLRRAPLQLGENVIQARAALLQNDEQMIEQIRAFADDRGPVPLDGGYDEFNRLLAQFLGRAGRATV